MAPPVTIAVTNVSVAPAGMDFSVTTLVQRVSMATTVTVYATVRMEGRVTRRQDGVYVHLPLRARNVKMAVRADSSERIVMLAVPSTALAAIVTGYCTSVTVTLESSARAAS